MVIKHWLKVKKVPDYRFNTEFKNVVQYMFGLCVALDQAIIRGDTLPARVQYVIWGNVYSGELDPHHPAVILHTKYLLRQLNFILQVPTDHVLTGRFVWSDFPIPAGDENAPMVQMKEYPYILPKYRQGIQDLKREHWHEF